jgi:amidase
MKLTEYARYDGLGLAELVRKKQVKARELCELALAGVAKVNPTLNCVIQTFPERVAKLDDAAIPDGPFRGVPFMIKDLFMYEKGVLSEGGSQLTKGFVADHDSELMVRFRQAGFINLGRTATPELGYSSTTSSRLGGITRNPWNPERISGGSSGGSTVAVASGILPIAHASDGGGSIRSPSCFNGLVGLKPTRGRISEAPDNGDILSGMAVNFAVTRTVRDCAAALDAVAGPVPGDPNVAPAPARRFLSEVGTVPGKLRIAYTTKTFSGVPIDPEIVKAVENTVDLLRRLGFSVHEARPRFDWPTFNLANNVIWTAHMAHGCDALGKVMGRKPGPDNLQRTSWACYEFGKKCTASDLLDALDVFNQVSRRFGAFFEDYDVFIAPTCTKLAEPHAVYDADQSGFDAMGWTEHLFALEVFLVPFNVTGQPGISLPLHQTAAGSQIGMHFAARFGDEATLFRLAGVLEKELPWRDRRPPIHVAAD